MSTGSGVLEDVPRSVGGPVIRVMMVMLRWLTASVQDAAFWALLALVIDAAGLSPLLVSEPTARLKWALVLGAVTGAGRLLHEWEPRQRAESER